MFNTSGQGASTNNPSPFSNHNPFQQEHQNKNNWFQPNSFGNNNTSNTKPNQPSVGFFANTQQNGISNVNPFNNSQNIPNGPTNNGPNPFQNRNPRQQKRGSSRSMQGGKQFHGSQGFNLNNNNMNNQPFGNNANVNASPFVATDTNNNFSNNNNQSFFNANPAMNESKQSNFFSSPNNNFKKPFINKNFNANNKNGNSNSKFKNNFNNRNQKNNMQKSTGEPLTMIPTLPTPPGFKPRMRPQPEVPSYLLEDAPSYTKLDRQPDSWDLDNQRKMLDIEKLRFQGVDMETIYKQLQEMRENERTEMEKRGFVDRLDVRKNLRDAICFVGTCTDMCPTFERIRRSFELDTKLMERDQSGNASRELAVKAFSRPAAGQPPPLPSDVRPPAILVSTLYYLIDSVVPQLPNSHTFLWDRTRSIRQDFTYQNYIGPETILCNELIARIHILSLHVMLNSGVAYSQQQEIEQFNKTLQTLSELYSENRKIDPSFRSPREAEFRAYQLLSHIYDPEIAMQIQGLPSDIINTPELQLALTLRTLVQHISRVNSDNPLNLFVPFFRLLSQDTNIPFLYLCLLEMHFQSIRINALVSMSKSYHHRGAPYLLSRLTFMLGFDSDHDTSTFCTNHGLKHVDDQGRSCFALTYGLTATSQNSESFKATFIDARQGGKTWAQCIYEDSKVANQASANLNTPFISSAAKFAMNSIKPGLVQGNSTNTTPTFFGSNTPQFQSKDQQLAAQKSFFTVPASTEKPVSGSNTFSIPAIPQSTSISKPAAFSFSGPGGTPATQNKSATSFNFAKPSTPTFSFNTKNAGNDSSKSTSFFTSANSPQPQPQPQPAAEKPAIKPLFAGTSSSSTPFKPSDSISTPSLAVSAPTINDAGLVKAITPLFSAPKSLDVSSPVVLPKATASATPSLFFKATDASTTSNSTEPPKFSFAAPAQKTLARKLELPAAKIEPKSLATLPSQTAPSSLSLGLETTKEVPHVKKDVSKPRHIYSKEEAEVESKKLLKSFILRSLRENVIPDAWKQVEADRAETKKKREQVCEGVLKELVHDILVERGMVTKAKDMNVQRLKRLVLSNIKETAKLALKSQDEKRKKQEEYENVSSRLGIPRVSSTGICIASPKDDTIYLPSPSSASMVFPSSSHTHLRRTSRGSQLGLDNPLSPQNCKKTVSRIVKAQRIAQNLWQPIDVKSIVLPHLEQSLRHAQIFGPTSLKLVGFCRDWDTIAGKWIKTKLGLQDNSDKKKDADVEEIVSASGSTNIVLEQLQADPSSYKNLSQIAFVCGLDDNGAPVPVRESSLGKEFDDVLSSYDSKALAAILERVIPASIYKPQLLIVSWSDGSKTDVLRKLGVDKYTSLLSNVIFCCISESSAKDKVYKNGLSLGQHAASRPSSVIDPSVELEHGIKSLAKSFLPELSHQGRWEQDIRQMEVRKARQLADYSRQLEILKKTEQKDQHELEVRRQKLKNIGSLRDNDFNKSYLSTLEYRSTGDSGHQLGSVDSCSPETESHTSADVDINSSDNQSLSGFGNDNTSSFSQGGVKRIGDAELHIPKGVCELKDLIESVKRRKKKL